MNKIIRLLIVSALLCTAACKRDKAEPAGDISGLLVQGKWTIHYFFLDKDITSDFAGYAFTFSSNGTLVLEKGGLSYTGAWKEFMDNGERKLMIQIHTLNFIQALNDDWEVRSVNNIMIELNDDDPARDEQLHLARL